MQPMRGQPNYPIRDGQLLHFMWQKCFHIDFYVRLSIDLGFPFLPHLRGWKSILADGFYVIEAMVGGGGRGGWRTEDKTMHILPTLKSTLIFKTFVTGLA
jgi:hypothetical protein